jgi:hypothetical protein
MTASETAATRVERFESIGGSALISVIEIHYQRDARRCKRFVGYLG